MFLLHELKNTVYQHELIGFYVSLCSYRRCITCIDTSVVILIGVHIKDDFNVSAIYH